MTNDLTTRHSNTTSISGPINAPSRAFLDMLAALRNGLEREPDGTLWVTRLPTAEQRGALEGRADQIRRSLRPASFSDADKQRAARALTAMLMGWINAKTADPKATVAGYVMHLQDLPVVAIERVCADVARGAVPDLSPDFPPSAARLHQLGEAALEALRVELAEINQVLGAKLCHQPSAEERERIRVGFARLHDTLSTVPADPAEDHRKAVAESRRKAAHERRILNEYERMGVEPVYFGGMIVSPALLEREGRLIVKKESAA